MRSVAGRSNSVSTASGYLRGVVGRYHRGGRGTVYFVAKIPKTNGALVKLRATVDRFRGGRGTICLSNGFPLMRILRRTLAHSCIEEYGRGNRHYAGMRTGDRIGTFVRVVRRCQSFCLGKARIGGKGVIPVRNCFLDRASGSCVPARRITVFSRTRHT